MTSFLSHPDCYEAPDRYTKLLQFAQTLAFGNYEAVCPALAKGSGPDVVKLFLQSNLDKRLEKLGSQLEFLLPAFDDPQDLLLHYIRELPLAAYDTGSSDGERFLHWLEGKRGLTPEQSDYVACQRARFQVEEKGRANRQAHIRFQELSSVADQLSAEPVTIPSLRIHLNPLRVWSQFVTKALLDEDATPPTSVLFFPRGNDIHTAVLEPEGRALLDELSRFEPCTVGEWTALSEHAEEEELIAVCRDLAGMGLVAFS